MRYTIFDYLAGKTKRDSNGNVISDIKCSELADLAIEAHYRELAFNICVNMIGNYIAACEFKTFQTGKEKRELEYWTWNIEPNPNQNKTAFIQKAIYKLLHDNECLIVSVGQRENMDYLCVADSFECEKHFAVTKNKYTNVVIGDTNYRQSFKEADVIHIVLGDEKIKELINKLYNSYSQLIISAMNGYKWKSGQHWKVHIDQMSQGDPNFKKDFQEMIENQLKPFFDSEKSILPEFDGYTYTDVSENRNSKVASGESTDIRKLINDVFDITGQAFGIPPVLLRGEIAGIKEAIKEFYTRCDVIKDQFQAEINRKRFGFDEWQKGNYMFIDSSAVSHFDIFDSASNIEKLVGSAAFSINDILAAAGRPKINESWADEHFMTKNIGSISELKGLDAQKGGN